MKVRRLLNVSHVERAQNQYMLYGNTFNVQSVECDNSYQPTHRKLI